MNQDLLAGALIGLARSLDETNSTYEALLAMLGGLRVFYCGDDAACSARILQVQEAKKQAVPDCSVCTHPCGRTADYDMAGLAQLDPELAEEKRRLLQQCAIYACTHLPGRERYREMLTLLTQALFAVGYDWFGREEIRKITEKLM